jgi:hypothetical protein
LETVQLSKNSPRATPITIRATGSISVKIPLALVEIVADKSVGTVIKVNIIV